MQHGTNKAINISL